MGVTTTHHSFYFHSGKVGNKLPSLLIFLRFVDAITPSKQRALTKYEQLHFIKKIARNVSQNAEKKR